MQVLRGIPEQADTATVLTIGNFDGVHLGHRALLREIRGIAKARKLLPAVLTFEPHPRDFFVPDTAPTRLSTLREKLELIADEGIDLACVWRFNTAMATPNGKVMETKPGLMKRPLKKQSNYLQE